MYVSLFAVIVSFPFIFIYTWSYEFIVMFYLTCLIFLLAGRIGLSAVTGVASWGVAQWGGGSRGAGDLGGAGGSCEGGGSRAVGGSSGAGGSSGGGGSRGAGGSLGGWQWEGGGCKIGGGQQQVNYRLVGFYLYSYSYSFLYELTNSNFQVAMLSPGSTCSELGG
jgi:hypothetical protein